MKKNQKNDNSQIMVALKLAISGVLSVLYVMLITALMRNVYPNSYYYSSETAITLTIICCGILVILGIIIRKDAVLKLLQHKRRLCILLTVLIAIFLLPISFLKQGTLANDYSIQKKNLFGKTVKETKYQEIEYIDVSVKYGIQYDIKLKNGDSISLCSHDPVIKGFKNDEDLLKFDKLISQYADKGVSDDDAWIMPNNTRRFFDNEKVFKYFDDFFKQYYTN